MAKKAVTAEATKKATKPVGKKAPVKKRRRRSAQDIYEETVQMVVDMLEKRAYKGEIKRQLFLHRNIEFRQAENYIAEAKKRLLLDIQRAKEEHRSEAYAFYVRVAADEEVPMKERLRAQERIDKLLGLESPIKVASTDTAGNDVTERSSACDRLLALANRLANRG